MYDISERQEFKDITVSDLMTLLLKYSSSTRVKVNGSPYGFIHYDEGAFAISFSDNPLTGEYDKVDAIKREKVRRLYE